MPTRSAACTPASRRSPACWARARPGGGCGSTRRCWAASSRCSRSTSPATSSPDASGSARSEAAARRSGASYQAGDGKWFVIGMLLERGWPDVAHVIGRPDIIDDPRFATFRERVIDNAPALIEILDRDLRDGAGARVGRQAQRHRHVLGAGAGLRRGRRRPAGSRQRLHPRRRAPRPRAGAHDGQRLRPRWRAGDASSTLRRSTASTPKRCCVEAGYTWDEIAKLRAGSSRPAQSSRRKGGKDDARHDR